MFRQVPGGASEKVVGFSVHEFRSEFAHLFFHFPHFGIESLPNITEFAVNHAEVTKFNGNISVDGHFGSKFHTIFKTQITSRTTEYVTNCFHCAWTACFCAERTVRVWF